jgi:D-alanine-D-alanine ligase
MSRTALVVMGSLTSEDKYGVTSGTRVAEALIRRGWIVATLHATEGAALLRHLLDEPPEVVVPVGFGPPCEDGHVCAVARMAGIPCAGPTPGAGGLMQDKSALSRIVDAIFPPESRVRSPRGCVLTVGLDSEVAASRVRQLTVPLVIKPAFSGSSEGLGVVRSHEEALAEASALVAVEGKVLVQELERPVLSEVSCTVLDTADGPQLLPIVELKRDDVLVLGPEEKFGAEGLNRHVVPATLTAEITTRIGYAVMALHDAVGSIGLTRTDALVLPDGEIVVLELNGIPGLLESSIACDAARAAGISFDELSVRYAESAFIRRPEPRVWEPLR